MASSKVDKLSQTAAMAAAILYWSCDPARAEEAKQRSNDIAKVRLLAPSAERNKKEAITQKVEHLLSRELGHQKGHTKRAGAATPKRLELEKNGPRIWAALWLSFIGEGPRGVDVWGSKAGQFGVPQG